MRFYHTPLIIQKLFPRLIWRMPGNEKCIYLTFDDGPSENITEWIAGLLKEYNAKGSFFCVGANLDKFPHKRQALIETGHTVANHTYNHLNAWKTPVNDYMANAAKCEAITCNKMFRPPYGLLKFAHMKALLKQDYKVIMWDVLTYDFDQTLQPEAAFKKVLKYTRPGSIILLHDNIKAEKNLKYLLPRILEHYSKLGFTFQAL
jgi:peptidoglycan/xylan/chitin deacetylase (PgdA/CDA1 family)